MGGTIQEIFEMGFAGFAKGRRLPLHWHKAARSFQQCRTAWLGGHVQVCDQGHVNGIWYNSCRRRACAKCSALARERWLEAQKARLVDCPHRHLIFTIPHQFHALWRGNTPAMMALLFQAVRATLVELTGDARYLGAMPGFLLALHTWGRSLSLHPHIHCLITEGGLDAEGHWKAPRRASFLPARVVMALFRGKFLAGVAGLLAEGAHVFNSKLKNSILGRGVKIEEGCEIKDSIIMDFTIVNQKVQ